jgi:hypothetical protein
MMGILDDGTISTDPMVLPAFSERYEMQLDLGTVDATIADVNAWMLQRGTAALKQNNRQTTVDAEVTPIAPHQFDYDPGLTTNYFLGDTVTVIGEYGVTENMLVTEYVRSYDGKTGQKNYPTLAHVNPSAS